MSAKHTSFELRFHHAMPGWCKIIGLQIKPVPECEGGGYKIPETQARLIVAAVNACAGIPTEALEAGVVGEMQRALSDIVDNLCNMPYLSKAKGESP